MQHAKETQSSKLGGSLCTSIGRPRVLCGGRDRRAAREALRFLDGVGQPRVQRLGRGQHQRARHQRRRAEQHRRQPLDVDRLERGANDKDSWKKIGCLYRRLTVDRFT